MQVVLQPLGGEGIQFVALRGGLQEEVIGPIGVVPPLRRFRLARTAPWRAILAVVGTVVGLGVDVVRSAEGSAGAGDRRGIVSGGTCGGGKLRSSTFAGERCVLGQRGLLVRGLHVSGRIPGGIINGRRGVAIHGGAAGRRDRVLAARRHHARAAAQTLLSQVEP